MAILVVFGRNNAHADAKKDARGSWKLGDVVDVFEDDKPVIRPPAAPFYIIKVSGISKAQAEKYLAPETQMARVNGEDVPQVVRRRLYRITVADIPLAARQKLQTERYLEIDWTTLRSRIANKVTDARE